MTPIHELLNRIRWDKTFGRGRFEIGFWDRCEGVIHRVALQDVAFPESAEHTFQFVDETGEHRRVPFHRIREVYRDGALIWQRGTAGRQGAADHL
ncbi:MAG TPA: DUF504 domain-containing protein [Verrucomicrobiota bacterium]|nr:DUF504 domain-containing protein [Verrucomicrobiota bacterium]